MSGMGIFPDQKDLRVATAPENRYSMEEIDNLLQRSAQNFKAQRYVLMHIPKKVEERSLEITFGKRRSLRSHLTNPLILQGRVDASQGKKPQTGRKYYRALAGIVGWRGSSRQPP
jgi:hypothetical protein